MVFLAPNKTTDMAYRKKWWALDKVSSFKKYGQLEDIYP